MLLKWLTIFSILLSSVAVAEEPIAPPIPPNNEKLEARDIKEEKPRLKIVLERTALDRKRGISFNLFTIEGGFLKALGLSIRNKADTECYIRGTYIKTKCGHENH